MLQHGWTPKTLRHMKEASRQRPHMLDDSIYRKCPELANPQRHMANLILWTKDSKFKKKNTKSEGRERKEDKKTRRKNKSLRKADWKTNRTFAMRNRYVIMEMNTQ